MTPKTADKPAITGDPIAIADMLLAGHRARTFVEAHSHTPCRDCIRAVSSTLRALGSPDDMVNVGIIRAEVCDLMQQAYVQIDTARDAAVEYDGGTL